MVAEHTVDTGSQERGVLACGVVAAAASSPCEVGGQEGDLVAEGDRVHLQASRVRVTTRPVGEPSYPAAVRGITRSLCTATTAARSASTSAGSSGARAQRGNSGLFVTG